MPDRIDFWGIPENWGPPELWVYAIMGLAALILLARFYAEARKWLLIGRPERRWDRIPSRFGLVLNYALLQSRVLSQRYPGVMHAAMAWSFLLFFLGTALATVDAHILEFLRGHAYLIYKLSLDLGAGAFLIGAAMAAYRRWRLRPPRLTLSADFSWALVALSLIVLGGLLTESLRLAVEKPAWSWWSPAGWTLAQVWIGTGIPESGLLSLHAATWISHLVIASATLATLPFGSLRHIVTAPANVFFAQIDSPMGRLLPIATLDDGDAIYASGVENLTWKQLLDGGACTECGRCQDACPAFAAGTQLSPKRLVLGLREALQQHRQVRRQPDLPARPLVGDTISDSALWNCTTCAACATECPILVEHLRTIVDMRRFLVVEGRLDSELQDAFANMARYGNSFGQSERARARWTQSMDPRIKDIRQEPAKYLWFVGDYASYNPGLVDATVKTAQVLQKAGVDFGILYEAERNSGNDVRRAGEEGLFELLLEKNLASIEKCTFDCILTTDPHSYNTLKNEYSLNGGRARPVFHIAELLDALISSGALRIAAKARHQVTFHDPCYLGRYNGIYDAPRRIIQAVGCELVEMPRHHARAACCGAGGGRIWMNEGSIAERPSEARVREAGTLPGVDTMVVACPKDASMFRDAVKTTGMEGQLAVMELVELVHAASF